MSRTQHLAAEAVQRMTETQYLYRGVPFNHPAYAAALQGRAVPGNPNGAVTPEEHNEGEQIADSPSTSFTRNYQLARNFAMRNGPRGVILRFPIGAPKDGDRWYWTWSPDSFGEDEILLHGERSGATVELL